MPTPTATTPFSPTNTVVLALSNGQNAMDVLTVCFVLVSALAMLALGIWCFKALPLR